MDDTGSLFDARRDTPKQIARVLVEVLALSKAEVIPKGSATLKHQTQTYAS